MNKLVSSLLQSFRFLFTIVLLGIVFGGGFYAFKKYFPVKVSGKKPTQVVGPLMQNHLPDLLGNLDTKLVRLPLEFSALEKAINLEKNQATPQQSAWELAGRLCLEIKNTQSQRQSAREALLQKKGLQKPLVEKLGARLLGSAPANQSTLFTDNPEQRWAGVASQHREAVKTLYLQMSSAEQLAVSVSQQYLVCPLCKAEGRLMLRRLVNGTITDISKTCPLCLGAGKKNLRHPNGSTICPDCSGFGRTLLVEMDKKKLKKKNKGIQTQKLNSDGSIPEDDETATFLDVPKITACTRCLSRGYITQPGLR
jgi:hypothetical protein